MRSSGRKAISLYTGAGGLDLGFEAAGFKTCAAVELDPTAVQTLRMNRDWKVIDRDIHSISSKEILAASGLKEGEADILIGGPPCQPFSKAGYWASGDALRLDDPRAQTLAEYLRVVRDTLPKAFLLENVPGLSFSGKSEGLELIRRTVRRINRECRVDYELAVAQLNAADFGVPQLRERVFVVASREGQEFDFPRPIRSAPSSGPFPNALAPYATSWDAIGDLEADGGCPDFDLNLRGKWAELLPSIPEGENYLWHTDRGGGLPLFGWRRRYWSFLLKLGKAAPSWTIQAQPGPAIGPFHWKSRRLSPLELRRLQTFPEDYSVVGTLASIQRQLGNAVPSALAECLARAIRKQFFRDAIGLEPSLAPAVRKGLPAPERIAVVPKKFLKLRGQHSAHPGTGRGFAANARKDAGSASRKADQQLHLLD